MLIDNYYNIYIYTTIDYYYNIYIYIYIYIINDFNNTVLMSIVINHKYIYIYIYIYIAIANMHILYTYIFYIYIIIYLYFLATLMHNINYNNATPGLISFSLVKLFSYTF